MGENSNRKSKKNSWATPPLKRITKNHQSIHPNEESIILENHDQRVGGTADPGL